MITNDLKEIIKKLARVKIWQAEAFIGDGQGQIKLEYVVNLIIDELKKLPLPIYIKVVLVLFQFAFKSELRQEIQKVFNDIKNDIHESANYE